MRSAVVVAAIMALAPVIAVSNSIDSGCRGDCVGNGNARDGRECFNDFEVQTLDQIVPVLTGNGTSCPEQQAIVGARVTPATGGCNRIDVFYCQTAVSGLAEGFRLDREPRECFNAGEASDFRDLTRTIQRNGTVCPMVLPVIGGVKLQKTNGCWRAPAVYCQSHANIVIYASDLVSSALHGSWTTASDATSPNGLKLVTPDNGWSTFNNPLASPADYIDVAFNANAGTPYTLWLRLQALGNSKWNDSVWVQFSDAQVGGSAIYPMNSSSGLLVNLATDSTAASLNGWGWDDSAYWLSQTATVTFAGSGAHTLRIQVREDGVQLDQIVLSPSTYLDTSPGARTADSTIVPTP
jgi:hypothetical protein